MRILWDRKEATVRDIQQSLPPGRHYNTILTIVRVLERKSHVTHKQEGRGFLYRAVAPPEKSRTHALAHFVESVFGGSPESIVLKLIETETLTLKDLDAIRRKLRKRAQSKEGSK